MSNDPPESIEDAFDSDEQFPQQFPDTPAPMTPAEAVDAVLAGLGPHHAQHPIWPAVAVLRAAAEANAAHAAGYAEAREDAALVCDERKANHERRFRKAMGLPSAEGHTQRMLAAPHFEARYCATAIRAMTHPSNPAGTDTDTEN